MADTERPFVLCYVDGPWAWFTTAPLAEQWGDDWDDAPYEHNAGSPYEWRPGRSTPPYELRRVAWEGPFTTPSDNCINSWVSVQAINAGHVAWLRPADRAAPAIPAGVTLDEFIARIEAAGGTVYLSHAKD